MYSALSCPFQRPLTLGSTDDLLYTCLLWRLAFSLTAFLQTLLGMILQPLTLVSSACLIVRWHNHLNPNIKRDAWTEAEDLQLIRAHRVYGNKWAEIAKFLPGR